MRNFLDLLRGPRGTLVILAIVGVVALVGATTAFAVGGGGGGGDQPDNGSDAVKGSVAAPGDSPDDKTTQTQDLQKLAKIDQSTAEKAALQAVPGTVENAKLDNENGSVIYQIQVAGTDGQTHQVKVDAGNGKVLQQDTGGGNEPGGEGND